MGNNFMQIDYLVFTISPSILWKPQPLKMNNTFDIISIHNFRRLQDVVLELAPLNVMIGANGIGKTSVLEVFSLLAASAAGNLNKTISGMGGVDANLTDLDPSEIDPWIQFELMQPVTGHPPLRYSLFLEQRGVAPVIARESLSQYNKSPGLHPMKYIESASGQVRYLDPKTNKLRSPNWEYDSQESALSQVPKMYHAPEKFRQILASSTHYHVLDVSARAPVRLPQQMRDAQLPGRDGEDLVSCLYWMREAAPERFEVIEDTLRAGFPRFDRLNFPPVAAGTLALTWKEKGIEHPFYMHQLSEGTLRFLWLITLLYSPGLTGVTLLDEPEVSLHPELLSILADCLREASQRTQLIVATHADRLIRFLQPDEVVVLDALENGMAKATRADQLDLKVWLKEYSLDHLWQQGTLGGKP